MTYNFDPERWYKNEFEFIKTEYKSGKITKQELKSALKEKQKAYGKSLPKVAQVEFSLTPQAKKIWDATPGDFQMKILNNVWGSTCSDTTGIGSVSGKIENLPC